MNLVNTVNNIIQPHFCLVDNPFNNNPISFEHFVGYKQIFFWKLQNKSEQPQNELDAMITRSNVDFLLNSDDKKCLELLKINKEYYFVLDLQPLI